MRGRRARIRAARSPGGRRGEHRSAHDCDRSSGIDCEPRPGCGSQNGYARCGRSAVVLSAARCLSVERGAHPRGPPDDLDVLRRGSPRPDVLALPEMAPHFHLLQGGGADDLHRGTVVVAEPGPGAAAESAQANPGSRSTSAPALTHRPIGAGGAAVAEPTDTAADTASPRATNAAAATGHQLRRGESAAASSPHAGEPKMAPSCSGIDVAFPHQWWRGQHSSPIPGRWSRGLAHNAQPVCGRGAQIGPSSCSTAPAEPRFSDAEIPKSDRI